MIAALLLCACGPAIDGFRFLGDAPNGLNAGAPSSLVEEDGAVLVSYPGLLNVDGSQHPSLHAARIAEGRWSAVATSRRDFPLLTALSATAEGPMVAGLVGGFGNFNRVDYLALTGEGWEERDSVEVPVNVGSTFMGVVAAKVDPLGRPWLVRLEDGTTTRFFRNAGAGFEEVGTALPNASPSDATPNGFNSLVFDAEGQPYYVAFVRPDPTTTEVRVFTLNEAAEWSALGGPLRPAVLANDASLAMDREGRPVVALQNNAADFTATLELFRWTGDAWSPLGSPVTRLHPFADHPIAFDAENVPHVLQQQQQGLVLSRLSGDGWETMGGLIRVNQGAQGFNTFAATLALPANGRPLVIWSELLPPAQLGPIPVGSYIQYLYAAEFTDED